MGCRACPREGRAVCGLTMQHEDTEGHAQELDRGVDALAADGQLVDILHRLPPEGGGTVYGQRLTIRVCNKHEKDCLASRLPVRSLSPCAGNFPFPSGASASTASPQGHPSPHVHHHPLLPAYTCCASKKCEKCKIQEYKRGLLITSST